MKRIYFACLFLVFDHDILVVPVESCSCPDQYLSGRSRRLKPRFSISTASYRSSFEANHGQTDARVKFLSRTGGYTLFLTGDEAVLALSGKKAST